MKCKYKIVKTLFSVLIVLVLLCTFAFNIFAYDSPAMYSVGGSFGGNDIYTGNVDYLISFYSESVDATYSYAINPCFSYDENLGSVFLETYDYVYFKPASAPYPDIVSFNTHYSDFECSDNFFTSYIPPVNSYFSSVFSIALGFDSSYSPDLMTVEARDFYFYLDPNGDYVNPYYDDYYCESSLYLESNSIYSGAEATICYVEAGVDDSSGNYQFYNYSLSSSLTNGTEGSNFPILPGDQSFDGTYSEPTLIYVKYLQFVVPLVNASEPSVSGYYISYNMDYRNIDLSSYVAPKAPMNPDIFRDYTGWLGTAVGGFLDLQIVDGFTLGGILMVIIAFMITLWFLKVFAGG